MRGVSAGSGLTVCLMVSTAGRLGTDRIPARAQKQSQNLFEKKRSNPLTKNIVPLCQEEVFFRRLAALQN